MCDDIIRLYCEVPAYSIGVVLNNTLMKRGRAAVLKAGREWKGARGWRENAWCKAGPAAWQTDTHTCIYTM